MKRLVCVFLSLILIFSLCSCGSSNAEDNVKSQGSDSNAIAPQEENDSRNFVDVDPGLFNVTLTVPSDFVDADMTQEELDKTASELGYKSATLNEDRSVTYVMTKEQHKEMMSAVKESIDDSLSEIIESGEYPNFVSIEANENYTEYTVVTKSEELDFSESFSVLAFYIYSGMYYAFNGTEVDNICVQFINETSGEVIEEANSRDMENQNT